MTYQQLTEGKRYQISILLAQGYWPAFIAKTIDVHSSTVYRELDQNRSKDAMNTIGFMLYGVVHDYKTKPDCCIVLGNYD
ncbi:hypothetical protein EH243_13000 [Amphritea opalescens]|uniref:Transposase IS30-like HTH domain-containing protein n=1 Tax=Amphritea opalescens TaxID=2490544 RepID=A0A430KPC5_9GAMM|nr:hypothetical protein EH243_13000 [Amphritea opalescens]